MMRAMRQVEVLPNALTLILLDEENARASAMPIHLIEDRLALNRILPDTARQLYEEVRGYPPAGLFPEWIREADATVLEHVINHGATLRDAATEAGVALGTAQAIMRRHGYTARRTIIWTKEKE